MIADDNGVMANMEDVKPQEVEVSGKMEEGM